MLKENKLTYGIRIFENPILDKLSRIHPAVPGLTWGPAALGMIGYGIYAGAGWHMAWLLPLGIMFWTLAEYFLHRFFFHWVPKNRTLNRMMYYVHEHHHLYQEWDRLVAPPLMAVPIFMFFLGLFYLTLGPVLMWPFTAGFIVGYLGYDYIHFYTHFAKPKSLTGKTLRKRHYQHHFARPDRWFGISNQLWDFVFGTAMRKDDKSFNSSENKPQRQYIVPNFPPDPRQPSPAQQDANPVADALPADRAMSEAAPEAAPDAVENGAEEAVTSGKSEV